MLGRNPAQLRDVPAVELLCGGYRRRFEFDPEHAGGGLGGLQSRLLVAFEPRQHPVRDTVVDQSLVGRARPVVSQHARDTAQSGIRESPVLAFGGPPEHREGLVSPVALDLDGGRERADRRCPESVVPCPSVDEQPVDRRLVVHARPVGDAVAERRDGPGRPVCDCPVRRVRRRCAEHRVRQRAAHQGGVQTDRRRQRHEREPSDGEPRDHGVCPGRDRPRQTLKR